MTKKKLIVVIVVVVVLLGSFAVYYKKERSKIYSQLEETSKKLPDNRDLICTDEFNELVSFFAKQNTSLVSNSSLKKLNRDLLDNIENGNCFNENYKLCTEGTKEEILNAVCTEDKYKTTDNNMAIFLYTRDCLGQLLDNDDGYVDVKALIKDKEFVYFDSEAKMKIRGNSTSGADKKPYNIKFSEKVDLMNAGKAKKWSILAERFDPTLMRNYCCFDLADIMDMEYTSTREYVEVWLDGEYNGLYLLIEPVESGKDRVDIDVEDGDFMFEYESDRVEEGATYITTNNQWRFVMNDPEDDITEEQLTYFNDVLNSFDETVFSNDYNKIEKIIDVDSFAKMYLLNEFVKTVDFSYSSVKFYYKNGKIYAGPVWDFDLSSGNANPENSEYANYFNSDNVADNFYDSAYGFWCNNNPVFKRLLEYKEFKMLVKEYFEKYKNDIKEYIRDGGILDTNKDKYSSLIKRDLSKWGYYDFIDLMYPQAKSFEKDYERLKNWLNTRHDWMDKELSKW